MDKILYRYSAPCQYDVLEYGTLVYVDRNTDGYEIYKQTSKDADNPIWELQDNDAYPKLVRAAHQ